MFYIFNNYPLNQIYNQQVGGFFVCKFMQIIQFQNCRFFYFYDLLTVAVF